MRYTVETVGGDELEVHQTLTEATRAAVSRLEDDPELGTLHVYSFGRMSPMGTHEKTVTHGPDVNWNSVVVVLDPGEKVDSDDRAGFASNAERDAGVFFCNPDESGGYALTDPKHERHHEVMSDVWDSREKV